MMGRSFAGSIFFSNFLFFTTLMGAAHSAESGARLSAMYFEQTDQNCKWQIRDPLMKTARTYLVLNQCPNHVLIDRAKKKMIFNVGHKLYSHSWPGGKTPPLFIGNLPKEPRGPGYDRVFLTKSGRKIRFAYLQKVSNDEIVSQSGKKFYRRNERLVPADVLDFGLEGFAVVKELGSGGSWTEIVAVPTNWAACDTMGLDILSNEITSMAEGTSEVTAPQGTIEFVDLGWKTLDEMPLHDRTKQRIRSMFPSFDPDNSAIAVLPFGKNFSIVFLKTHIETRAYPEAPVFLCDSTCDKKKIIVAAAEKGDSLSVRFHLKRPYMAIAEGKEFSPVERVLILKERESSPVDSIESLAAESFHWLDVAEIR